MRQGRRRKLWVRGTDDLAPLWADLKAAIMKALPGGNGGRGSRLWVGPLDVAVYKVFSRGYRPWD